MTKAFEDLNPEEMMALEEAALLSALDMGPAENMWHPDWGQIIKDGELTEAGKRMFEEG
jgi:hypothetical protein